MRLVVDKADSNQVRLALDALLKAGVLASGFAMGNEGAILFVELEDVRKALEILRELGVDVREV